ncbi:MAG TPA: bifunctional methionine sulfoxide reductase B/A protein [Bacteroidetes bacterium]|nr:bifunctional methionine sulfoxide reductase B/A protein [Bacteroidota bacterium]
MKPATEPLTPLEQQVIEHKATEVPFTGKYVDLFAPGTYHCRRCGAALYRSKDKFDAHCGWPAFDAAIPGAVRELPDADGVRTECVCAACGAHLGHVFSGEGWTERNTRYCINSMSMVFVPQMDPRAEASPTEVAVLASGCFWGTEYWLSRLEGVLSTEVGYAGGWLRQPSYQEVKTGGTGHLECVRVVFDPAKVSYRQVLRQYFNTFDFEQADGQGPDIGPQYRSAIFYTDLEKKHQAEQVLDELREKGYRPVTQLRPLDVFYPEQQDYHRHYYDKTGDTPYCHLWREVL